MPPYDDTTSETRFDQFYIYHTSYKNVGIHRIEVAILVPKNPISGKKHPLAVKFHGGGLVAGDCLYTPWFASFLIPLLLRTNSIAILPNYRLIPESSGADIISDLTDFWTWFSSPTLPSLLATYGVDPANLDFDHVLSAGDSAGGYMALMSGLTQPKDRIQAILAQYPMTNYLRREPSPLFMDAPSPPASVVDEYLARTAPGSIVTSSMAPERLQLSYALSAYGRYLSFFGSDPLLWPIGLIESVDYLPPTWIIHGDADTAVDVEDSRLFVERVREGMIGEVRFDIRVGMEHGFDIGMRESEEAWLKEGLRWTEEEWLGKIG